MDTREYRQSDKAFIDAVTCPKTFMDLDLALKTQFSPIFKELMKNINNAIDEETIICRLIIRFFLNIFRMEKKEREEFYQAQRELYQAEVKKWENSLAQERTTPKMIDANVLEKKTNIIFELKNEIEKIEGQLARSQEKSNTLKEEIKGYAEEFQQLNDKVIAKNKEHAEQLLGTDQQAGLLVTAKNPLSGDPSKDAQRIQLVDADGKALVISDHMAGRLRDNLATADLTKTTPIVLANCPKDMLIKDISKQMFLRNNLVKEMGFCDEITFGAADFKREMVFDPARFLAVLLKNRPALKKIKFSNPEMEKDCETACTIQKKKLLSEEQLREANNQCICLQKTKDNYLDILEKQIKQEPQPIKK